MTKAKIIQSIEIGTMIKTGCNGRWSKPKPVSEVRHRGVGVNGAYAVVTIADTENLRGGKVWSWTTFGVDESDLGRFCEIAKYQRECGWCKVIMEEGEPELTTHGVCDVCLERLENSI